MLLKAIWNGHSGRLCFVEKPMHFLRNFITTDLSTFFKWDYLDQALTRRIHLYEEVAATDIRILHHALPPGFWRLWSRWLRSSAMKCLLSSQRYWHCWIGALRYWEARSSWIADSCQAVESHLLLRWMKLRSLRVGYCDWKQINWHRVKVRPDFHGIVDLGVVGSWLRKPHF